MPFSTQVVNDLIDASTGQEVRVAMSVFHDQMWRTRPTELTELEFKFTEQGRRYIGFRTYEAAGHLFAIEMLMPIFSKPCVVKVQHVIETNVETAAKGPDHEEWADIFSAMGIESVFAESKLFCISLMPKLPISLLRAKGYKV